MNSASSPLLAVACAADGTVTQVIRDGWGVSTQLVPGTKLQVLAAPESAARISSFLSALRGSQIASDWEVEVRLHDRVETVRLTGVAAGDVLLVLGTRTSAERGDRIFEKLGHLNEELVYLHRELAQRNADLARANAELTAARKLLDDQNAALLAANAQLAALVTLDGLTGVKNRRAFDERLADELRRARRHGQPLSLVLLDVDHFKAYNDTYGHLAGDEVLKGVGRLLQANARGTDFVARFGGEEFAVLLIGTTADEARAAAERLRQALAQAAWPARPVTGSFGVATLAGGTLAAEEFVAQADQALYNSKAAGRNCVTHWLDLAGVAGGAKPE